MITAQRAGYGRQPEWWMAAGVRPIAAYQPKGAASLEQSYINLANPGTNNATPVVAPTLNASGWGFSRALSTSLLTGIYPDSSTSIFVSFIGVTPGLTDEGICGGYAVGRRLDIYVKRAAGNTKFGFAAAAVDSIEQVSEGVLAIASGSAYKNGVIQAVISAASFDTASYQIPIGCASINGTLGPYTTATVRAFCAIQKRLSETEVFALSTAMAAL